MRIHFVMHESFEAPAAIESWAMQKKHPISFTRLYTGEKFPSNYDSFDFLVVMGGPQSPTTTKEECSYFDAKAEIEFIKSAVGKEKVVLGVCLGAQMIGNALGGNFYHSPDKEIGVYDVSLTKEAQNDPIFSSFPKTFSVGHWHGDMPGLTLESAILAKSAGCPRQIIRYTPKVYGFQCHFEFTHDAIEGMIKNCSGELDKLRGGNYIQTAEQLRKNNYKPMNDLLFKFLDHMEKTYG